MNEQPKRRWFRFRLSTVLIVTAIVAWGMACWPWLRPQGVAHSFPVEIPVSEGWTDIGPGPNIAGPTRTWFREQSPINPSLIGPALALLSLVGWKAGWALRERRRNQLPIVPRTTRFWMWLGLGGLILSCLSFVTAVFLADYLYDSRAPKIYDWFVLSLQINFFLGLCLSLLGAAALVGLRWHSR
jgi:hypothetical protein